MTPLTMGHWLQLGRARVLDEVTELEARLRKMNNDKSLPGCQGVVGRASFPTIKEDFLFRFAMYGLPLGCEYGDLVVAT